MDKISRLTKNIKIGKSINKVADAAFICHVAKKAIGGLFDRSFCKEIEIASFKEGVLYISTPNGSYAQEIKMREGDILKGISNSLKNETVKKIRFKNKSG